MISWKSAAGLPRISASISEFRRIEVSLVSRRRLEPVPAPDSAGSGFANELRRVAAHLLAAVFLIDDVRGLPVLPRFLAQFIAAIWFLAATGPYSLLLFPLLQEHL